MMQISPNESFWHGVGVEIQLVCPELCLRHKTVVLRRERGGACPTQPATQSQRFAQCKSCICKTTVLCRRLGGACSSMSATQIMVLCRKQFGAHPRPKTRSDAKKLWSIRRLEKSNYVPFLLPHANNQVTQKLVWGRPKT